jgi:hypothetical protein
MDLSQVSSSSLQSSQLLQSLLSASGASTATGQATSTFANTLQNAAQASGSAGTSKANDLSMLMALTNNDDLATLLDSQDTSGSAGDIFPSTADTGNSSSGLAMLQNLMGSTSSTDPLEALLDPGSSSSSDPLLDMMQSSDDSSSGSGDVSSIFEDLQGAGATSNPEFAALQSLIQSGGNASDLASVFQNLQQTT